MSFHQNESLERLVKNSNELYKVVIWYDEMIQKSNPIYRNTESLSFIKAPFYASSKNFFGTQMSSYWVTLSLYGFSPFSFIYCFILI